MSNLDTRPAEHVCSSGSAEDGVELLGPRDVPLGGPRAMTVRRTIPQRSRSLVGAWCFSDHYGPDDVSASAGMQVPPHPHTGLQTVSWLFEGEILHRDSVGSLQTVRPGELNLMTAGTGISHSEESPSADRPPRLHGIQLWTALPGDALGVAPRFEHHGDLPVATVDGGRVQVFVGSLRLAGHDLTSPATTYSPLVGAQLDLEAGAELRLDIDPGFEHGLVVDAGDVRLEGVTVAPSSLAYVGPGRRRLAVTAGPDRPARAVLIGGEPFTEDVVMWWNFVGRTHDDVARARDQWMAQIADLPDGLTAYADGARDARFGRVDGYASGPLRAPALPEMRLKPRTRPA
ncbi:pirin family protein [Myceligenerans salitolerans]|uniref:Pirin family protein n=1 Tax=Myceligenerans salitolerans TaxID=1230528 RepID=A0ABS3I973_9MICO|nr:pirin family protein [Myceligenerans salitolerans]MBO0609558.1 pirin family protein [Myceligenerans salitolerans]